MCRESQRPHGDEADGDEENGYRVLGEQAPLDDFLVGLRDMDMAPVRCAPVRYADLPLFQQ